ncbi:MAG: M48 family metallopeptidase [Clostridia bacterium]|nr:M48 family metallopeptidase [Clostridia bacterium]
MAEYTLVRSSRRTMSLEITVDLRVLVRAPFLCSKREIDRFVTAHADWIEKHVAIQRRRNEEEAARQVSPEEEMRLRALAQSVIPLRVAYYSEVMGLVPTGVRITSARKRFGSCSSKNSLCFSWRLMQYSLEAIDYVVVHELAHIRHHDHSAAFHALVESVLPDHRARRALLRG